MTTEEEVLALRALLEEVMPLLLLHFPDSPTTHEIKEALGPDSDRWVTERMTLAKVLARAETVNVTTVGDKNPMVDGMQYVHGARFVISVHTGEARKLLSLWADIQKRRGGDIRFVPYSATKDGSVNQISQDALNLEIERLVLERLGKVALGKVAQNDPAHTP